LERTIQNKTNLKEDFMKMKKMKRGLALLLSVVLISTTFNVSSTFAAAEETNTVVDASEIGIVTYDGEDEQSEVEPTSSNESEPTVQPEPTSGSEKSEQSESSEETGDNKDLIDPSYGGNAADGSNVGVGTDDEDYVAEDENVEDGEKSDVSEEIIKFKIKYKEYEIKLEDFDSEGCYTIELEDSTTLPCQVEFSYDKTGVRDDNEKFPYMVVEFEKIDDVKDYAGYHFKLSGNTMVSSEEAEKPSTKEIDEIDFNTGNKLYKVVSQKAFDYYKDRNDESHSYDACYDKNGNYTINIGDNPFFPYEVQFKQGYKTESKWFMSPSDSVKIGEHEFTLSCHIDDQTITSVSFDVGGKDILAYPVSKTFTDDSEGGISTESLLPLDEQSLQLDLTQYNFTPIECTMIRYGKVYSGDKELESDAARFALRSDEDYTIYNSDEIIPLRSNYSQSIEVIVGDGDQLTSSNVRCSVYIKKSSYSSWITASLYAQDDDGGRKNVTYSTSSGTDYVYAYSDGSKYNGDGSLYLSLKIDKESFSDANYKDLEVFKGNYTDIDSIPSEENITNQILSDDMTVTDAGFEITEKNPIYVTMVTYGENGKVTGCLPVEIYTYTYTYTNSASIYYYPKGLYSSDYVTEYGEVGEISTTTYKLKNQEDTKVAFYAYSSVGKKNITAAYAGDKIYDYIADAKADNATDVTSCLFDSSKGYETDYSKGVYFTVFIGEDNDTNRTVDKKYIMVTVNKTVNYDIAGDYIKEISTSYRYYNNGEDDEKIDAYTISLINSDKSNTEYSCYADYSEAGDSVNSKVSAAYAGKKPYSTIEEARADNAIEVDINNLFNKNVGYKADYSDGIYFSIFIKDDDGNQKCYKNFVKVKNEGNIEYKMVPSNQVASSNSTIDSKGVENITYTLESGHYEDEEYTFYASYVRDYYNINKYVAAAYVGLFDSIDEANIKSNDIKDELFNSSKGYTANYSEGVYFTIFVQDSESGDKQGKYQTCIKVENGQKYSQTSISFDAVIDASGNKIKAYSNNLNDDTYAAEYNFITLIVDADIDNIAPVFTTLHKETVYTDGQLEKSGESYHDFSKGAIQYTVTSEDKEHQENYWLQVVKPTEGKNVYINSLEDTSAHTETKDGIVYTTREIRLDKKHDNVHNVFIANMGLESIKNLKVELNSKALKLDSYWTLSGKNDLETFNVDHITSRYSDNIAKVVLRENDDVEYGTAIEGTMTIKSGTTTLMVINLTGVVGSPVILTKEIPNAVKYVPYGIMIQNSNKYSWNKTTYSLTSGALPEGMILKPNGEVYGVPKESGEFKFTVSMENSSDEIEQKNSTREFTLIVDDNTDENVDGAVDEGYELSDRIEDTITIGAVDNEYLVVSEGVFTNFVDLYVDGEKLAIDKDYTGESGSTRLTISGQALDRGEGTHTIGIEFRETDTDTLKRAAQNYNIASNNNDDNNSSSNNPGSGSNGNNGDSSSNNPGSGSNGTNEDSLSNNPGSGSNGNNGDSSSSDSLSTTNTSSSSSSTNASSSTSSANVVTETVAALDDGHTVSQAILSGDHILRNTLLQKLYGQNTYLAAIFQPDFGLMIDMAQNPVLANDIEITYNKAVIAELAPEFNTILVKSNKVNKLGFNAIFNFNVGEAYIGKKAYVYMLNDTATGYDFVDATVVNSIGNVAFTVDKVTDFIILVEK
jgi:hypothetical protein